MKIKATHNAADDNLRLQWHEPYCNLARALINRMYKDSLGKVGHERDQSPKVIIANRRNVLNGIEFMKGYEFRHWCELLGATPDDMLEAIAVRENDAD